jgi:zinc-finger-containing domain
LICPNCYATPTVTQTRYGPRWSCCDLWAWGDAPLVDAATHEARRNAHKAFDPIWKSGRMTRSAAYALLADRLELEPAACHMRQMDAASARRVIEISKEIYPI